MTDQDKYLLEKYPLVIWASTPVLRKKAVPIWKIDYKIRVLAHDLLELMRLYDGVWLAAPQINHSLRMFAYTQRDTSKKKRALLEEWVMINPKIVAIDKEFISEKEWCLSLPWIEWDVLRSIAVTMHYLDTKGKEHIKKATGYNARILLHELDHLDGVLFIDKAEKVYEMKKGK